MKQADPNSQYVDDVLRLYLELLIPFMKVRRDMPFPTESERQETDGEHAFTLAMIAISLARKIDPSLDTGLIAQYALVHDLVEAYAGDVSVRHESYHQKEAAEAKALVEIQTRFADRDPWIGEYIEKYESRIDKESRFVYVVDKCVGALARLADDGESWADYYPEADGSGFHKVVDRLRAKAEVYPELLGVFDAIHDELDQAWPAYLQKRQ